MHQMQWKLLYLTTFVCTIEIDDFLCIILIDNFCMLYLTTFKWTIAYNKFHLTYKIDKCVPSYGNEWDLCVVEVGWIMYGWRSLLLFILLHLTTFECTTTIKIFLTIELDNYCSHYRTCWFCMHYGYWWLHVKWKWATFAYTFCNWQLCSHYCD